MSDRHTTELDHHIIVGPLASELLDCAAEAICILSLIDDKSPSAQRLVDRLQRLLAANAETERLLANAIPRSNLSDAAEIALLGAAKRLSNAAALAVRVR